MKTFWSIIAILVIATAALWVINGGAFRSTTKPTPAPQPTSAESATPPRTEQPAPAQTTTTPPTPTTTTTPPQGHNAYHSAAPTTADSSSKPEAKNNDPAPLAGLSELLLKGDTTDTAKKPADNAALAHSTSPTTPPSSLTPAKPDAKSPEAPTPSAASPGSGTDKGPAFTLGPPTDIKHEDDGWTRLDGRYLVRGNGTSATDPLIVPWELLVSASESYRPRTGLKEMPRRVADLKGKHVKITGYVLFPLMSLETTEVLLMRNQWDGCCIGVPPTPYDAVEVKLAKPADRKDSLLSFVTIEGVIDVDPYLNKDFLLGLYTLSEGAISQPAKGKDDDKGL